MRAAYSHFKDTLNAGDRASCPRQYFDLPEGMIVNIGEPLLGVDVAIYGGGAVARALWDIERRDPDILRIAWGVGGTERRSKISHHKPHGFALYGSRDWPADPIEWVPCVSCMSPLFDRSYKIERDAVLFFNADPRIPRPDIDLPAMSNQNSFSDIVVFLGSAETIVTNSYHGSYWATLLGRKSVIVGAYSSKFYGYRFRPGYDAGEGWFRAAATAVTYPHALSVCRRANLEFYDRVTRAINEWNCDK